MSDCAADQHHALELVAMLDRAVQTDEGAEAITQGAGLRSQR